MAEDVGGKVVWFVAGAAIGAAVALLYAPASGEETRKKIADTTGAGRDALAQSGKEATVAGQLILTKAQAPNVPRCPTCWWE